jgi:hypothetical protein
MQAVGLILMSKSKEMRSKTKSATHHTERLFISMALAGGFNVLLLIAVAGMRIAILTVPVIITSFSISIRGHNRSPIINTSKKSLRHASCNNAGVRDFISACLLS